VEAPAQEIFSWSRRELIAVEQLATLEEGDFAAIGIRLCRNPQDRSSWWVRDIFSSRTMYPSGQILMSILSAAQRQPFYASNDGALTPSATLNQNTCTLTAAGAANFACTGKDRSIRAVASTLVAVPGRNPQPNVSQYILTRTTFRQLATPSRSTDYLSSTTLISNVNCPAASLSMLRSPDPTACI